MNLIQIKKDNFIVQGITIIDNKILISAYSKEGKKSRIYVYDNENLVCLIKLNSKAHVGGITHGKVNNKNILFVTGVKGSVQAFDYDRLNKIIQKEKTIDLSDYDIEFNKVYLMDKTPTGKASTIYYFHEYLYVAQYNKKQNGILRKYKVEILDNELTYIKKYECNIPKEVQGIAITYFDDKKLLLLSRSRISTYSRITAYEIIDDNNEIKFIGTYRLNKFPGIEGIKVLNNNIYACSEVALEILILTINNLINNLVSNKKL